MTSLLSPFGGAGGFSGGPATSGVGDGGRTGGTHIGGITVSPGGNNQMLLIGLAVVVAVLLLKK